MNAGNLVYVLWPHGDTDEEKNRLALVLDGLTQEMLDYEIQVIHEFVKAKMAWSKF